MPLHLKKWYKKNHSAWCNPQCLASYKVFISSDLDLVININLYIDVIYYTVNSGVGWNVICLPLEFEVYSTDGTEKELYSEEGNVAI